MSLQMTELHYDTKPRLDATAIAARAEEILASGVEAPNLGEGTLLFSHTKFPVEYEDGTAPAQTAVLEAGRTSDIEKYTNALRQSWHCENAEELLSRSQYTVAVTEMLTRSLDPAERLRLFHGVLQAVVELTSPVALVFLHSQQVVDPQVYLDVADETGLQRPGALNVRFFNIANAEGDMLMDTRGMVEAGLHDLQCHFRDLDPEEVARVLYNTAYYIGENGPVIESGHTIAGIEADSEWECQFEDSLVAPERPVLDLNPGGEAAAGDR